MKPAYRDMLDEQRRSLVRAAVRFSVRQRAYGCVTTRHLGRMTSRKARTQPNSIRAGFWPSVGLLHGVSLLGRWLLGGLMLGGR